MLAVVVELLEAARLVALHTLTQAEAGDGVAAVAAATVATLVSKEAGD